MTSCGFPVVHSWSHKSLCTHTLGTGPVHYLALHCTAQGTIQLGYHTARTQPVPLMTCLLQPMWRCSTLRNSSRSKSWQRNTAQKEGEGGALGQEPEAGREAAMIPLTTQDVFRNRRWVRGPPTPFVQGWLAKALSQEFTTVCFPALAEYKSY